MSVNSRAIDNAIDVTINAKNVAKNLGKLANHNSIMRMASAGIYQYPGLFSSNMSTDEAITISRSLEKQYACAVVIAYSLNGSMDMTQYNDASDFVKKFHQNDGVSDNFKAVRKAVESAGLTQDDIIEYVIESVQDVTPDESKLLKDVAISCWDCVQEQLDMDSLNDVYKPYERTKTILKNKITDMKAANEAITKNDVDDAITKASDKIGGANKTLNSINNAFNKDENADYGGYAGSRPQSIQRDRNEIIRNDKLTALEPTMVNVNITAHGKTNGNMTSFNQTLTLGVKVMTRLVRSDLMISNIVEACKSSNGIFKFIKWAKGELRIVRDGIFGISEARQDATSSDKIELKILKASKKRKNHQLLNKMLKKEVFPSLTIIMTSYEVAQVNEICGVDLSKLNNALSVMDKYFLLGFGIYDPDSQTLQILFDSDSNFSYTTINVMKRNVSNTGNLVSINDIAKGLTNMMGRM